jgi:hypothetical protein
LAVYSDTNPTRYDAKILAEAEAGDADSQYLMGVFQSTGRQGISRDPEAARRWFEAAAAQNHAGARYRLGDLYRRGAGVPKNLAKALHLFQRAAAGGSQAAQNAIGDFYRNGDEVEKDLAAALAWYHRAAEAGFAPAQRNMGFMAASGLAIPRDYGLAFRWYRKAAAEGDVIALHNLGVMYEHGQAVAADPLRARACYFSASLGSYEPAIRRRNAIDRSLSADEIDRSKRLGCLTGSPPE